MDSYDAYADSKGVGYDMTGITQEGKAVTHQTADDLCCHYEDRHKERYGKAFIGA